MTTAIDTNILVALWDKDDALNTMAQAAPSNPTRHDGRGSVTLAPVEFWPTS